MKRVGFINATSGFSDDERARRYELYRQFVPSDYEVVVESIAGGPQFFDRRDHFGEAVSSAQAYFRALDPERFSIVVWAGAIDPGLEEVRAISPVPVVGPGESGMYLASVFGRPLSIVTVDEHAVAVTREMLAKVPAKPPIASIRSMDVPVRQILSNFDTGREALERESRLAVVEDGAEALYLGSMTLGTLGLPNELREELRVPVFNPMRVAIAVAVGVLEGYRW